MVELTLIEVPEKIFDMILDKYPAKIKYTKDIWNCFCGTPIDKRPIYTDNTEWIVCQEYILDYISELVYGKECITGCTSWKQVRIRKVVGLNNIQRTYNGSYCYNYIMRIISKYYNKDEIDNIFCSHSSQYDDNLKQWHYSYLCDVGELIELDNCVKYDINGAHASAVVELFPKAKDELLKLYNKKDEFKKKGKLDEANKIKALFNFFVGMLKRKGYEGTYNYIVQSITKKLKSTRYDLGGVLIYANTDSICLMNPDKKLKHSKEIGEFKLEGEGTMYWYRDKNYVLLEYTNIKGGTEQVGSCKLKVRDKVSLKDKLVVHYDCTRELIGFDDKGQAHFVEHLSNIRQEKL